MRHLQRIHPGLIALVILLVGCASSTSTLTVGETEVHTVRLEYNNTHVVTHKGHSVLVDAGLSEDAAELDAALRDAGYDPATFEAVIVTHGHADHVGGAKHFADAYGTPIVAGKGDADMMAAGRNDLGEFCPTDSTAEGRLEDDQGATYPATIADVWIEGDMPLHTVSGLTGDIVLLPGHTPGSLAVVTGDVVLVGDLFRGAIVGGGAEVHFYMCDLDANRADIEALLKRAPNADTFLVGHFGPLDREDVQALIEDMASDASD